MSDRDWLAGWPWYQKLLVWASDHLFLTAVIVATTALLVAWLVLTMF